MKTLVKKWLILQNFCKIKKKKKTPKMENMGELAPPSPRGLLIIFQDKKGWQEWDFSSF